jgi:hypothetical protein
MSKRVLTKRGLISSDFYWLEQQAVSSAFNLGFFQQQQ